MLFGLPGWANTNTLSIGINTNSWTIGTVPVGGRADTWLQNPGAFVVTNDGNVAATLYISVSNSAPDGWVPAAFPGLDRFRIRWSLEDGSALPQYTCVLPSPLVMTQGFDTNRSFGFDLEFAAPMESGKLGVTQQIRLVIMAVKE